MTARRRPSHTDQLKTLQAEMDLFEDRLRNARYASRPARWLLSLAAFFAKGEDRRLREAIAARLCPLCDRLDFPECAECECPGFCGHLWCPQGSAGGSR